MHDFSDSRNLMTKCFVIAEDECDLKPEGHGMNSATETI